MRKVEISVVTEKSKTGLSSILNRRVRKSENSGWEPIMNSLSCFK